MNARAANRSYVRKAYRTGLHGWSRDPSPFVLRALERIRPGKLLDLGCGEGRHSIVAAKLGFQVVAVDAEPLALARARKNARGLRVKFLRADALALPFGPGEFDAVIDWGCLHHQKKSDWPRYLAGLLKLLKPDGYCVLEVFSPGFRLFRGARRSWHVAAGAYRRCFTRRDLRGLFQRRFEFIRLEEDKEGGFWRVLLRRKRGP
ncbi:MAG: class I SAM-dependent methyltransferase [Elusimicrobia bacterium]|nr:class I SAM-dependent methyltransferase [Elusimicrobiota bacterium]